MKIDKNVFNAEWKLCEGAGQITENMGKYLLDISSNIAIKYGRDKEFTVELREYILMDVLERFFKINVKNSALAIIITTMSNRAKNFRRNVDSGNRDIYNSVMGMGRGSRWTKKEFRNIKIKSYGNIEALEGFILSN